MAGETPKNIKASVFIDGKPVEGSLKGIRQEALSLRKELSQLPVNTQEFADKLAQLKTKEKELIAVKNHVNGIEKAFDQVKPKASGFKDFIGGIAGGIVAGGAIAAVGAIITKIKDAYAETAKFRAILTNAFTGDSKAANDSLKMLQDFAASTPFQLTEITEGYIKLVNRGFKPTQAELIKMGDLSASLGKSLDQYIEALLDAQTGEFERLKEFGIRASKNGDTVTLSFKGITKEVKNTDEAIRGALLSFGDIAGVKGAMESVSKTVIGLASNVEDSWNQIYAKIGQNSEGIIKGFYQTYSNILSYLNTEILGTESNAQKLTSAFNSQAQTVSSLEKNTIPLINRYEELRGKSNLNQSEQKELDNVIAQLALTIPSAVTEFDKYGKALGINTGKAKEFVKIQQEMLKYQNKEAIAATRKELAELEKSRENTLRSINRGTVDAGAQGASVFRKMTPAEINEQRDLLTKFSEDIANRQNLLKGLTGDYMNTASQQNKAASDAIANAGKISNMTIGELRAKLKSLNEDLEKTRNGSKEYKQIVAQIQDVEKLLSNTKTSSSFKAGETAAQKLKTELENVQKLYTDLSGEARAKTVGELDKQLFEIDKKFNSVINKLKKLSTLKGITGDQKKSLIEEANDLIGLRDTSKEEAKANYISKNKDAYKPQEKAYANIIDNTINEGFEEQQTKNKFAEQADLMGADSEEQRLQIKATYQAKELQMEMLHLQTLKDAREGTGRDSLDLDKQISDQRLKIGDFELQGKISQEAQEKSILQAKLESAKLVTEGMINLASAFLGKSKASIAVQKGLALAQIGIDTALAITSLTKNSEGNPANAVTFGAAGAIQFAAGLVRITANILSAKRLLFGDGGGSISESPAATPALPQGRSYAKGGYVSNATIFNKGTANAYQAGEAGKEWIAPSWMVQSPSFANTISMLEASRANRTSGYTQQQTAPVNAADNSRMESLLMDLIAAQNAANDKQVVFSHRAFEESTGQRVRIRNDVDA